MKKYLGAAYALATALAITDCSGGGTTPPIHSVLAPAARTQLATLKSDGTNSGDSQSVIGALDPAYYYKLDDASGSTATETRGRNNGTFVGSYTLGSAALTTGDRGSLFLNDGGHVATNIAQNDSLYSGSDFTVSAWVKIANPYDNVRLVANSHADSNEPGFQLYANGGNGFSFDVFNTSLAHASFSGSANRNTTYNVVGVVDSAAKRVSIYVNGVAGSTSAPYQRMTAARLQTALGYNPSYGGDKLVGNLGEVAFFKQALTPAQVASIYNAGSGVAPTQNANPNPNPEPTATPNQSSNPNPPTNPAPNQHVKFGTFARLSPIAPPFGMFSSPTTLDDKRTRNILDLGARWTRSPESPFYVDKTVFGPGKYDFSAGDLVTSFDVQHNIEPVVGIEAGPVQVNDPGHFDPHSISIYPNASAYANFCSVSAAHYKAVTHQYSIPGNEVNSDTAIFNGADSIAPYMKSCYSAIKAADPQAFQWGLELNMDAGAGAANFVSRLRQLGCGIGTCYDGLSAHLSVAYPAPRAGTPCNENQKGDYDLQCLTDLQNAAGDPNLPLMIGETVITWPGFVRDAQTQAQAVPADLRALASAPGVRYVNYANLDECALYAPDNYFHNGCLIDSNNNHVPAWQTAHDVFASQ